VELMDKTSAKLDFIQSFSGFILAIFIVGHIIFEASILISNDMMQRVTLMFEGYYFLNDRYPAIISFLAIIISVVFIPTF
jgi:fumarate reductase subunit C